MADLFIVESARMRLSWGGAVAPIFVEDGLRVEAVGGPLEVRVGGEAAHTVSTAWTGPLALLEETSHPVLLRSRTGEPVALRHRDPVAVGGLVAAEGGRVLHGAVRFGSFVGASRFVVLVGGRPEAAVTVTVAPAKVTMDDVGAMRREVEEVLAGLAVRYLSATTAAGSDVPWPPSRPVWLTHLRAALPELEAALRAVAEHPRTALRRTPGLVRADRLTRPDAAVRRALLRHGDGDVLSPLTLRLPTHPHRLSLDTPEHRWLRARVEAAAHRLAAVRREERHLRPSARRTRALEELDEAAGRLRRLLALAPLAGAAGPPPPVLPRALDLVSGYAEARAALRRLDVGLALGEGAVEAAPDALAELYETWCVLTVARTLARLLGRALPPHAFFGATARGVRLRLRRGSRHTLRLQGGGLAVRLAYEPRFPSPPGLLTQKPDLLLTVEQPRRPPRLFVLDAKYRRDDGAGYRRRHGAPGPPEDALGDLHRYRDAIVQAVAEGVERPVEAAAALFPFREPEPGVFGRSRLWTSIERIGVGAIPLLPGGTAYLERWLCTLLGGGTAP